jgi:RNA-directed DNA polymerase
MSLNVRLQTPDDELKRKFFQLRTDADVADLLEVPLAQFRYIIYEGRAHYPYRTFDVTKRDGSARRIDAPHPTIKILQQKLIYVHSLVANPRSPAHGFIRNRNIVSNARPHSAKRLVLNVDIDDFFPNINFGRVRGVFLSPPYSLGPAAATVIAHLSCHQGHLPQGAPTSPILSNMVCFRLDRELVQLAAKYRWFYTRYADDMTFSSYSASLPAALAHRQAAGPASLEAGDSLIEVLASNGFAVNTRKLRIHERGSRQSVTGLTVNQVPNVRRSYIRNTRAMIHKLRRDGFQLAEAELRSRFYARSRNPQLTAPSFLNVLRGRLDFISMVKGNNDPVFQGLVDAANDAHPGLMKPRRVAPVFMEKRSQFRREWQDWAELYAHSIYMMEVKESGDTSAGTAFLVARGLLATAAHTICTLNDEGEPQPRDHVEIAPPFPLDNPRARDFIVHSRVSEGIDLALVRLPEDVARRRRALPIRTEPMGAGEELCAFGYPTSPRRQSTLNTTPGYVVANPTDYGGTMQWLQVSFEGGGGYSGGPVIDRYGAVVGIVVEATYEEVREGVASRAFGQVVPITYLLETIAAATSS